MNTMQRQTKIVERIEQMLRGLAAAVIAMVPVAVFWTLDTQPVFSMVVS